MHYKKTNGEYDSTDFIAETTTKAAVSEWLEEHPETTTTVVDGSITKTKLSSDVKEAVEAIAPLKQRMNNLTQNLPSGSTSLDAEVIDIRVGADGKTYSSAGEAVRGQVSELKEDLSPIQELVTYTSTACTMANGTLQNTGNANAVYTTDYAPVVASGWGQAVVNRPLSADGNYYKFGWIIYDTSKTIIQSIQIIDGNVTGLVSIPENGAYIRYSIYEYNADGTLHTLRKTDFSTGDVIIRTIDPDNLVIKVDDLDERVNNLETGGNHEYHYSGEKIDMQHGIDFTQYTWYMPSPTMGDATALQGIATHNNQIFQFLASEKCICFSLESPTNRTVFDAYCGHGNSADFGLAKYDESDEYPICYVSDWLKENTNKVYALRVTKTSATLIKTYTFPFADAGYYAGACVDQVKNIMYLTGYAKPSAETNIDEKNYLIVSAWDMNTEIDNGDGTYSFAKIKTFEIPVFVTTMQDRCFKYGKIFVLSSPSGKPTTVYCISPHSQQITSVLYEFPPMFTGQEVEGMSFISENEMLLTYYGRPWKAIL